MQGYDVSEENIKFPLEDVETTEKGDSAITFEIEKRFRDLGYAMYNWKDHLVLLLEQASA